MKKYFTIQFNDLSDSKKEDMRESLYLDLLKDNKEVNFKDIENSLEVSWCELEVSLPDETSEDKWRTDAYIDYMEGKIAGEDTPVVDDGKEE